MIEIFDKAINALGSLTAEQITLISILVTLVLFTIGKYHENRLRTYETRKEQYAKLMEFFQNIFSSDGSKKNILDRIDKKKYFEVGASLAIFGSRRLYKTYCFYRMLAIDENIQKTKWYEKDMMVYVLGEMYQIMRKEIGQNKGFSQVDVPNILLFAINDMTKPEYQKKYYRYKYNKFVLKTLIFFGKLDSLPAAFLWERIIKPFAYIIWLIIYLPIRFIILNPIRAIKSKSASRAENDNL